MRISDWSSDVCSSDLVVRLVHGRVAAAAVGGESVLFEAAPGVVARRLEHHIDAPAQIARHGAAIALQAGDHLDLPLALQHAALRLRSQRLGKRIAADRRKGQSPRSEEHTSELQSLMRISYAVFCLKKNKKTN